MTSLLFQVESLFYDEVQFSPCFQESVTVFLPMKEQFCWDTGQGSDANVCYHYLNDSTKKLDAMKKLRAFLLGRRPSRLMCLMKGIPRSLTVADTLV